MSTTQSRTVVVDTVPPQVLVIGPADGAAVSTAQQTYQLTAAGNEQVSFECGFAPFAGVITYEACASPYQVTLPASGNYRVGFRARDEAGNVSVPVERALSYTAPPVKNPLGTLTQPKKLALTGTYKVGKTLKVKATGSWKPAAKLSYQWFASGKAIKGAKKASFKLKKAQAGKKITVKVTAKASGYRDVVKTLKGKKVKKK